MHYCTYYYIIFFFRVFIITYLKNAFSRRAIFSFLVTYIYNIAVASVELSMIMILLVHVHLLHPIYILYILQDAAFITEVHHINGEGEDAGVVYCEMQARENTSEDMTHYQLCQLMYPGDCGYKVQGIL